MFSEFDEDNTKTKHFSLKIFINILGLAEYQGAV